MDWDEPQQTKAPAVHRDLTDVSIELVEDYIGQLEAEIQRARADISLKKSARDAAESAFK